MIRLLLSFAFILALSSVSADTPQVPDRASSSTAFAVGVVPDTATVPIGAAAKYNGVPNPNVWFLRAPDAADVDYFADGVDATSLGALTLIRNSNQINQAIGEPVYGVEFSRNFVITPNQATTGTLQLVYVDTRGFRSTVSESFVNSSSAVTTAYTGRRLVSATVTTAFTAGTNLDIGTGVIFGLPYPFYANFGAVATVDAAADDYPGTADSATFVLGDPSSATADPYGTVTFVDDPDGTSDYAWSYPITHYYLTPNVTPVRYPLRGEGWGGIN